MLEGERGANHRHRRLWRGLLVIVGALLFTVGYLKSTTRWWYEDDPAQYATAAAIRDPVSLFVSPGLLRGFGTGASLVPMQMLSYWIDVHLFGPSPRAAYLHSLFSTLLTVVLIYLVLARMTGEPTASAFLALLWLALPSTIAVHNFLSTRHYMEGLGWSLAACYFLDRLCHTERRRAAIGAIVWLCACAAMLSKELYVIALPAWLFGYSIIRRRRGLAGAFVLLALGYAGYRITVLGTHAAYPVPPAHVRDYLRYLAVLPFTFSANRGGYVMHALLAFAGAVLLLRRPPGATKPILLIVALLVAALVPVYPTALAVLMAYETPGTWYRAVFLLNTVVLLGGGYLFVRFAGRAVRVMGLSIVLVFLMPGARRTRDYWNARFIRSEEEGRFYLANPDKLVYSEEDAEWFLRGLDRLYRVSRSHYFNKGDAPDPHARAMLNEFPVLWRYRDGHWGTDDELYQSIAQRETVIPRAR
jgi:hypothetical protein